MPPEYAWGLDDAERLAAVVTMGEFEGSEFNWNQMRWMDKS